MTFGPIISRVLVDIFDVLTLFGILDPFFTYGPKMTSDIPQYFNPLTFGSIVCDITHGNFKLRYISSLENDTEMVDQSMNPEF